MLRPRLPRLCLRWRCSPSGAAGRSGGCCASPRRDPWRRFPAVRLLLDLIAREEQPDRRRGGCCCCAWRWRPLVILRWPGRRSTAAARRCRTGPAAHRSRQRLGGGARLASGATRSTELLGGAEAERHVGGLRHDGGRRPPARHHAAAGAESARRIARREPQALEPDRPALARRLRRRLRQGASRCASPGSADGIDDGTARDSPTLTRLAGGQARVEALLPGRRHGAGARRRRRSPRWSRSRSRRCGCRHRARSEIVRRRR